MQKHTPQTLAGIYPATSIRDDGAWADPDRYPLGTLIIDPIDLDPALGGTSLANTLIYCKMFAEGRFRFLNGIWYRYMQPIT